MKCMFFNYDTGVFITEISSRRYGDLSDFARDIYEKQKREDILGIGFPCRLAGHGVLRLGISSYTTGSGYLTNINDKELFKKIKEVNNLELGEQSFMFGHDGRSSEPNFISFFDADGVKHISPIRIGVYGYPEGYVVSTGKDSYSVFGGKKKMYFDKITTRNFLSRSIGDCRRFKDLRSMLKYVEGNKELFKQMVEKHDYFFTWEYASPEFQDDTLKLSKRKKNSELLARAELEALFDEINNTQSSHNTHNAGYKKVSSKTANEDEIAEEILQRMDRLKFHPDVAKKFSKEHLMQSELGGILYDLDEGAQKAVDKVKSFGYVPYHIIMTNTQFGRLYSVLFASSDTEKWNYQRPNEKGCVQAYVYNKDEPIFSEFGDILVVPANGGIVRTA
jgi:hypothetical protein